MAGAAFLGMGRVRAVVLVQRQHTRRAEFDAQTAAFTHMPKMITWPRGPCAGRAEVPSAVAIWRSLSVIHQFFLNKLSDYSPLILANFVGLSCVLCHYSHAPKRQSLTIRYVWKASISARQPSNFFYHVLTRLLSGISVKSWISKHCLAQGLRSA